MVNAQELIDQINSEDDMNYNLDANSFDEAKVEAELHNSIFQELTTPMEQRNVYWAQTLLDSA